MTEKTLVLPATTRSAKGKKVIALRSQGMVPTVLYGHGVQNQDLSVDHIVFEKVYKQAGGSSLVDLVIDNKQPIKILIQDIQRDPVSGRYIHADFHQVKMTEKITTEVNLNFVGESKAVKELGGILVKNMTTLKIECLPNDLVHEITVDISKLNSFEEDIRIKDIILPAGIELKESADEVIANVQPPRSEEELKSLEEKPEEKVEDVAQIEKKKKEEGEEAEGEATVAPTEEKEKKT